MIVEAEKEEQRNESAAEFRSPSRRLAERTTTTTVPLRSADDSSSSSTKRGKRRPRKSLDTPAKRNGTPKPTDRRRRLVSDAADKSVFEDGIGLVTSSKKKTGRPRKSLEIPIDNTKSHPGNPNLELQPPALVASDNRMADSSKSIRKSRGRRKAITPLERGKDSEVNISKSSTSLRLEKDATEENPILDRPRSPQVHEISTLKNGDKGISVIGHEFRLKALSGVCESSTPGIKTTKLNAEEQTLESAQSPSEKTLESRERQICGTHHHEDGGSQIDGDIGRGSPESADHSFLDPTDEHQEFDSILESEGFSMVTVSSLPSTQQDMRSPANFQHKNRGETPSDARKKLQLLQVKVSSAKGSNNSGDSVVSDGAPGFRYHTGELPSLPPNSALKASSGLASQDQTPSIALTSPTIPLPLQPAPPRNSPRSLDKATAGTPKLARVVRAGIALQGVLSPERSSRDSRSTTRARHVTSSTSSTKLPKERLDNLFNGFGAGTRRELRAGLRLGEQLAKRQQVIADKISCSSGNKDDVFQQQTAADYPKLPSPSGGETYSLKLPEPGQEITYPTLANNQLPSPERSEVDVDEDRMSWKVDTPIRPKMPDAHEVQSAGSHQNDYHLRDQSMAEREAEWQREREAVSRQIQMANASQVIVIDSDSDDGDPLEEEDDEDIWLAEAHSLDPIQEAIPKAAATDLQDEATKPRRSKLPTSWRRDSQVVYSDEAPPNDSDLFWQPDKHLGRMIEVRENVSSEKQRLKSSTISGSRSSSDTGRSSCSESGILSGASDKETVVQTCTQKKIVLQHSEKQVKLSVGQDQLTRSEPPEKMDKCLDEENNVRVAGDETTVLPPQKVAHTSQPLMPFTAQPASTSWLSRLTSFAPTWLSTSVPAPAQISISPPPISKKATLASSEPLSLYEPWTVPHYRALKPLYIAAKLDPTLYPFRPGSASAWMLGKRVNCWGWMKLVEMWDLGVVDRFMEVLAERGVEQKGGGKLIGEEEVMKRVFSLWLGRVHRGEEELGRWIRGEVKVKE